MTSYLVYSTVALQWNRKIQWGSSCRWMLNLFDLFDSVFPFFMGTAYHTSFFSTTPLLLTTFLSSYRNGSSIPISDCRIQATSCVFVKTQGTYSTIQSNVFFFGLLSLHVDRQLRYHHWEILDSLKRLLNHKHLLKNRKTNYCLKAQTLRVRMIKKV